MAEVSPPSVPLPPPPPTGTSDSALRQQLADAQESARKAMDESAPQVGAPPDASRDAGAAELERQELKSRLAAAEWHVAAAGGGGGGDAERLEVMRRTNAVLEEARTRTESPSEAVT